MAEPEFRRPFLDDLSLLVQSAHEAGKIALRYFRKNPRVWMKEGNSPVCEADYAVDRYLHEKLLSCRPEYGWISEETGNCSFSPSCKRAFVVDPLDGTRGFLEGKSQWCISVAVVEEGRSCASVLDCPARGEAYAASLFGGATLNGNPLHVRPPKEFLDVVGPKSMFDSLSSSWQERLRFVDYIPSLAYRLALVACGQLDAVFIKPNAYDWDLAAADLVLHEAGGFLVGQTGRQPYYGASSMKPKGALAAGSGELFVSMKTCFKTWKATQESL